MFKKKKHYRRVVEAKFIPNTRLINYGSKSKLELSTMFPLKW